MPDWNAVLGLEAYDVARLDGADEVGAVQAAVDVMCRRSPDLSLREAAKLIAQALNERETGH
ncbi:hypothetical protein [Arenibaculum pallidiluteum]|uniref:hypothetical protein n=1 Tax=Arenibaculum pallidiluteum TaxID=2812559 RepID=UPI001A973DBE|nr:hypothetical protein [Arenibaculum pallidiluteum]